MKIAILSLFLSLSIARGGIHVEPYLGYMLIGDANDETSTANTKRDLTYNGLILGGRFGYNHLGLMAGFDFSLSTTFSLKSSSESGANETISRNDFSSHSLGIYLGYNFPALFRVWLTYFLRSELEGESGTIIDDEYKGNGFGLGLSYNGLPIPYFSINVEFRRPTYDEYFVNSSGLTSIIDYKAFEFLLSVSAPFDL